MTPADRRKKAGLLLDTNMLILLIVGNHDRRRIAQHNLTASYSPEDFDLLEVFMSGFTCLVTTPNILTEVSNLLGAKEKKYSPEIMLLTRLVANPLFTELYQPSQAIMTGQQPLFLKFGLSDIASCEVVKQNHTLLTADAKLYHYLASQGYSAVNFNHLRGQAF